MSELVRQSAAFSPTPEKTGGAASPAKRPEASQTPARWLFLIPAVATVVQFVAYWVPEVGLLLPTDLVVVQVSPLVAPVIASAGQAQAATQSGVAGVLPAIFLAAALVSRVASTSRRSLVRAALAPAALLASATALVQLLLCLRAGEKAAAGLVLLGVMAVLGVQTARSSLGVNPDSVAARTQPSVGALVGFGVSVVGPIALGRCLFAPTLRDAAARLPRSLGWSALGWSTSWPLWLAGMAVFAVAWALVQLVPPWRGRHLVAPVLILVLGIGAGFSYAFPTARDVGRVRAAEIATGSPADSIPQLCTAWWRRTTPERTIATSGRSCATVTVFTGYSVVASHHTAMRLGDFTDLETPEGDTVGRNDANALYGDVFVTAASTTGDDTADAVVGLDFGTGAVKWRWTCRDPNLRVRFAGTGHDNSGARQTRAGEGARVVVSCGGGRTVRLNPATGKA